MKQRVVVQAIIQSGDKVLFLRRSQGRPGIVGKYELPGGRLDDNEQPEDALRRHVRNDTGLVVQDLRLVDIVSITNREEGDVQHIFVIYSVNGSVVDEPIRLSNSYDQYLWEKSSEIQRNDLRDSARSILGLYHEYKNPITDKAVDQPIDVNNSTLGSSAIIYSDGGSRGNPGPSAAAFVIMDIQQGILDQGGTYLGITTNNQAEYHGVQLGLERAFEIGVKVIEFRIDSMLVVNQMKGVYKIKNRELWPINERIRELIAKFDKVSFTHVPRELNQLADSLVNRLLDEHQDDTE
ncbi:reverse transcriptase-like protein [Candidatus Saccharibacteria bacterium]|nr:reverse transcriptase-like protein [Candidatus Saccharibacteria bacterium]